MANHQSIVLFLVVVFLSYCSSDPLELDQQSFNDLLQADTPVFVKFYAPWCGHCKRLAPTWDELSTKYDDKSVIIAKVDCTQHTPLCSGQGVRGYPTLKLFVASREVPYSGQRDIKSLQDFIEQQTSVKEEGGDTTGLVHLDDVTFEPFIKKSGLHFVKFYAPWCGHCQRLAPTWEELATLFKDDDNVHIIKVDCTENKEVCNKQGVRGYPTLLLYETGMAIGKYDGARDLNSLTEFVKKNMAEEQEDMKEVKEKEDEADSKPVQLTSETFDTTIAEGLTFVKFYAPWCGHCQRLAPTWDTLAELTHATTHTTIAKVDCTVEKDLCGRYEVRGFPTLILFSDGVRVSDYTKARDLESFEKFLKDHAQG